MGFAQLYRFPKIKHFFFGKRIYLWFQVTVLRTHDTSLSVLDSTFSHLSKERNSFSKNFCCFEREMESNAQNAVTFNSEYCRYKWAP